LFPEIIPGRGGRTLGDVFFKTVWLNIKPHLTLVKPGQAVHSGRHMVSTELKMLQTFEEFRADLLGQKIGGENAGRYADATRLELLLEVVERIPVVTGHLPAATTINLLPKARRQPRPVRPSSGRRQRGASPAAA
ncbi:MAG: integrase, partial [Sphingomonadales bacterium]|nr:integrase [Sphingomonadales bacterium]